MELIIHNSADQPIYQQIYTQIQGKILSGVLPAGTPLPSIRALSKDLRISVITTKRAYDELEHAGYLSTVAGKGSFVADKTPALLLEQQLTQVEHHFRQGLMQAQHCGLTPTQLHDLLTVLLEEDTL